MMVPFDRDRLLKKTKVEILDEVQGMIDTNDTEHMKRLRLQNQSVMNLMRGRRYEDELEGLHLRIVTLEKELETAREELRKLRGEFVPAYNVAVREGL